jgi:class III poly(R)-hydroxyalkanoic acid synthase PhaE subunit
MSAQDTPGTADWAAAMQKTQDELMRQWSAMASAWSRATTGAPAAGAAQPAAAGVDPAAISNKFLSQFEQYLGVSRALWELLGQAARASEPQERARLFTEGLSALQQQFSGAWAATAFGAPLAGAATPFGFGAMPGAMGAGGAGMNPWAAMGAPFGGAQNFGFPGSGAGPFGKMPALGPAREQQESLQRLAELAQRCWQAQLRLGGQWNEIISLGLKELGEKLAPQLQSGTMPGSVKELYDLWVESAESAYKRVAHGAGFIQSQAELTNTLSQLRSAQRELMEEWGRQFDLPTRAELNSLHQQVRELKAALQKLTGG